VLFYVFFVLFYVVFALLYVLFVLCRSLYCWDVYMCTVLLPPGGYPIAVKYIIPCTQSFNINWFIMKA